MKFSRCDSENCRALLSRYDAPPAIDVANEESSSLQVRKILFLKSIFVMTTFLEFSLKMDSLNYN